MAFHVSPLPADLFEALFDLDDAALAARNARRLVAGPGMPCRVSLADAVSGETVILANYLHQPAATPFRASHAIYVRRDAVPARPAIGEMPPALRARTLSLRGFDTAGEIVTAELTEGADADTAIGAIFSLSAVAYIHAHYARYGCYAARIDRI